MEFKGTEKELNVNRKIISSLPRQNLSKALTSPVLGKVLKAINKALN